MHQATGDLLSQILQAGLDHGAAIRADFPGYPLGFLVHLAGDWRCLSTQEVFKGAGDYSIFVDRDLKEHTGVTLFFLDHCPDSEHLQAASTRAAVFLMYSPM